MVLPWFSDPVVDTMTLFVVSCSNVTLTFTADVDFKILTDSPYVIPGRIKFGADTK